MDRREISWIIVRAFGVYLLLQALIMLPELLVAGLISARYYSNVMSSLGPEGGNGGSFNRVTSISRTLSFAPLVRVVLYSTVGIYLVRGGRFVVHLLERIPEKPRESPAEDSQHNQR